MFDARKLVAYAKGFAGRQFNPGQKEQCMAFVRHCLQSVDAPVKNLVTKKAVDGLETSCYLASSLAGRDLGYELVQEDRLSPGSIVFFNDTYEGWWPPGTITHVGIYIGSGQFVHRPTVSKPVVVDNLFDNSFWRNSFRCGLDLSRPVKSGEGVAVVEELSKEEREAQGGPRRLKIFAHSGKVRVFSGNKEVDSANLKVFVGDGKLGVVVNGKDVDEIGLSFELVYRDLG